MVDSKSSFRYLDMKFLTSTLLALCFLVGRAQSTEGWVTVFEDDFSTEEKGWNLNGATQNISRISEDMQRLVLELFDHGFQRATNYTDIDFNKDFILKAKVGAKGDAKFSKKENSNYGLYIGYSAHRYKDIQGSYGFMLNFHGKGVRIFTKKSDGSIQFITMLKEVNYQAKGYNNIGIKKSGDKITYYINDKKIYAEKATRTVGGALTFIAFRKMKAFIKEMAIYQREPLTATNDLLSDQEATKIQELLNGLRFEKASASLTDNSQESIVELATLINSTDFIYKITSHTDDVGDPKTLRKISVLRAKSVVNGLQNEGVSDTKLIPIGAGDIYPMTSNYELEGRKMNERLTFEVMVAPAKSELR